MHESFGRVRLRAECMRGLEGYDERFRGVL